MSLRIHLHFVGIDRPALDHVEFWHPSEKELYLSVRGKTSGAYETDRTFQWTNAVQAVAILFLRMAIVQTDKAIDIRSPRSASLEGEKGSIVASLDYALDKQPAWLTDMFGFSHGGRAYFKNLITRSNPGLRREGTIRIGAKMVSSCFYRGQKWWGQKWCHPVFIACAASLIISSSMIMLVVGLSL